MPVLNRIAAYAEEMKTWRRHLHAHPELSFDCHETAAFITARLAEFGVDEVHPGIARTGIVAIINGQRPGPTIGLRADMDALPILEATGVPHASTVPGRMHACGHGGHVTMLLGAAKYLAETRNFAGRVALIFQPAEEDAGGGQVMVNEGIMDRFSIAQVYSIHQQPNMPLGWLLTTPGPFMAAVDTATVTVTGKGGHVAYPDSCIDPIMPAVAMVAAIQTILPRDVHPLSEAVVAVTMFHAGTASNIVPDTASFSASIRTFEPELRKTLKQRIQDIVEGHARAYGVTARLDYDWGYPATVNHPAETAFAVAAARDVVGEHVDDNCPRNMGSEDFSYLLEARPGAYLYLGTGSGPSLHSALMDFNDEVAPIGSSFFVRLVERAQPLV